jgi:hypothetical protein
MTQVALYAAVLWVTAAFGTGSALGAGVMWWDKRGDYEAGRQDEAGERDLLERDWMGAPEDDAVTVQWIAELGAQGSACPRESVLDRARRVVPQ